MSTENDIKMIAKRETKRSGAAMYSIIDTKRVENKCEGENSTN